ncbi:MAG: ATP-binding protein [Hyphomicrobiaceae bacterium]
MTAVIGGTFLLAYVALEWISFIHELNDIPVTPWNPGLGCIFSLMVLKGPAYGILLFAGVILAEVFILESQLSWFVIVAIATLVAAAYAATAHVARNHLSLNVGLVHLRDVVVLLASGVAGAVTVALLLALLFLAVGRFQWLEIMQAAVPLFVGDIIGIAIVTPLLLRITAAWRDLKRGRLFSLAPEIVLITGVIAGSLWLVVPTEIVRGHQLFYLLFLPVVVAAVRHGIDGACLALAATQFGLVGLLKYHGYDAAAFTTFQTLMFVLTSTGLLVGVIVSERRQAELAVREAEALLREKEAEAALAARHNLVSGMASALAHELNQPMTAARAFARSAQALLRSGPAESTRVDANLTNLVAQIDHASGVLRRMREFLRRGQPHFSTLDVAATVEDAIMLVRSQAENNRTSIEIKIRDGTPAVFGDKVQLQQVILNLVTNAIEAITAAQRPDGRIALEAWLSPDLAHVEISVKDNGTGVDAEQAKRLFSPLATTKQDGLGLGLSICASIIAAHHGRMWLQSSQPGATDFRLSLPVQQRG